jgi:hypothetical protein
MDFGLIISTSWTVKFADTAAGGWTFDHSKGVCWLDINHIEQRMRQDLAGVDVGGAVGKYLFGLEITDAPAGFDFDDTRDYVSHRRSIRSLISVGQLEWPKIRHLDAQAQFTMFQACALGAVERVVAMKRRPRDFDAAAFRTAVSDSVLGLAYEHCTVPA